MKIVKLSIVLFWSPCWIQRLNCIVLERIQGIQNKTAEKFTTKISILQNVHRQTRLYF